MSRQHWGEIKEENEDKEKQNKYVPDVMPDIERSMNNFSLNEFEDDYPAKNENIILAPMDPLMLYGISLHKYANDMIEMIRVAELATEVNLIPPEDAAPPIPPTPELKVTHQRNNLNYIEKEYTPFSRGEDVESPDLSETVVKQILQKCIVTIFAHVGFETTHKSVLDVLTDVLEEFLKKICLNLKNAAEDEETHGTTFPHAIERVLTQMGLGGVYGINDFYQCRVIKYIDVLRKRCIDLNDHYATLLVPQSPPSIDKLSKCVSLKRQLYFFYFDCVF
ncbi:unnamed protein product [Brassicogethes aeneus]|uniref:Bromodomain associated domain-containing protein n=1 Tax=Brassicogethes aeneus TaxID=1431903 RepID=A0A9P0B127_BRAAE|nr:unnamed protein product [Brassicogethes aeneus]